jgi:hypothetical protein
MTEKIFIGKVEVKETQFGEIIKIGFSPEDREKMKQYANGMGWINISILNKKQGGKYAVVDVYNATSKPVAPKPITPAPVQKDDLDLEEIPF